MANCETPPPAPPPKAEVNKPVQPPVVYPGLPDAQDPNPTHESLGKFRAVYLLSTDPPGVDVYRELGEWAGVTPLTLEFRYERITRLTFLRTGYLIQTKILEPLDGEHTLHIIMEPSPR